MRREENGLTKLEQSDDFLGPDSRPKRSPLSPKTPGAFDNLDAPPPREIGQVDAGRSTSSADCRVILDQENNCCGFPVVHCQVLGRDRVAVFTPTSHHRAIFNYMVQTRREGLMHREEEFSSLKLMEKLDQDLQRREEMSAALLSDGLNLTQPPHHKPAASFNKNEESIVEGGLEIEVAEASESGPECPAPEASRKNDEKPLDSRLSRSSVAKSSSNFVTSTLTHLLSKSETETTCCFPFRDQFGTAVLGATLGKSILPEALNSKRSFPGIYPADSIP